MNIICGSLSIKIISKSKEYSNLGDTVGKKKHCDSSPGQ